MCNVFKTFSFQVVIIDDGLVQSDVQKEKNPFTNYDWPNILNYVPATQRL